MGVIRKYKRLRSAWRRRHRLLFPSPAEVELVRIMGGHIVFSTGLLRDYHTGFPLTVLNLGPIFKAEHVEREVRAGAMYIDFGNDIKRGIEVDSAAFHGDVVKEHERDEYCGRYGWRLLHVPVADIYRTPNAVHDRVLRFLSS